MENQVKCPKCSSTQITAQKKGFSTGKAAAGAILAGGIGLAAGGIGSDDVIVNCLLCGNSWSPKKLYKQQSQEKAQKIAADMKIFKKRLYALYESGNIEEATKHFLAKRAFNKNAPDIHAGYKYYKSIDKSNTIGLIVFFIIIFGLVIWLLN